jgi:hypothetical protein
MTVRDLLTALQALPRDAELLAFEAGCEDYCKREVDEVEWQGGRVYLHLGARKGDPREASEPRRSGGAAPSPGAGSGRCSRSGSAPGSPGAPARPPRTDRLG